jgi:asparagine synthetase B (glutamine-hydrolysing)
MIHAYLYFGYVPRVPEKINDEPWVRYNQKTDEQTTSESELVHEGVLAFKAAFEDVPVGHHIVPLSGGLDSRAILGGLLDVGLKDQITTVTFGTPGTLDFDIGCEVAQKAGVRHESIDLTHIDLSQQTLENTARENENWVWLFDAFYNRLIQSRYGKDATYWSGFMGDPLAGSHLLPKDSSSWHIALRSFAERNRFSSSINLAHPDFQPEMVLPQSPIFHQSRLNYDAQLDFAIRQSCYIKTLVMPKGYEYRTPFLHHKWVNFILSLPRRYRQNQYLYKEILKGAYPKLFSLPTKSNGGLPLNAAKWKVFAKKVHLKLQLTYRKLFSEYHGVHPMTNYIDFDRALRERKDIKTLVYDNLQDLKKRRIVDWIDIDEIWNHHQNRQGNHADALTLLASLEIIFKVREKIADRNQISAADFLKTKNDIAIGFSLKTVVR